MTVTYKDLSGWLKFAAIISWIVGGLYVFMFLWGFFSAL